MANKHLSLCYQRTCYRSVHLSIWTVRINYHSKNLRDRAQHHTLSKYLKFKSRVRESKFKSVYRDLVSCDTGLNFRFSDEITYLHPNYR